MHLGLEGKAVLVTGGTKGIGRAIVEGFLNEGANVHFCARTQDDIDKANKDLAGSNSGAKANGAKVDISNPDQLSNWVNDCAKSSGRIDVVVANVSAISLDDTNDSWQTTFKTDMSGTYTLMQSALPHLEKTKGNIVTIASVSGRVVDFTAPGPYGAMKAAIIHYTAQLGRSLAAKGIRANTCSPGNVYFEGGAWGIMEKQAPEFFKSQIDLNPTGRMATPQEVANAVLFLASERASFISGTNLVVDGARGEGVQF